MDETFPEQIIRGRGRGWGRGRSPSGPAISNCPQEPPERSLPSLPVGSRGRSRVRGRGRSSVFLSSPEGPIINRLPGRGFSFSPHTPSGDFAQGPSKAPHRISSSEQSSCPIPAPASSSELSGACSMQPTALHWGSEETEPDRMLELAYGQHMLDSDSDDDFMAIGRQLREKQGETREEDGLAKLVQMQQAQPSSDSRGQGKLREVLSEWRQDLRSEGICCLNRNRNASSLEAGLLARWTPHQPQQAMRWMQNQLELAKDPCTCALVFLNASGKKNKDECPRLEFVLDGISSWRNRTSSDRRDLFFGARTSAHRHLAFFLGQREGMAALRRVVSLFKLDDEAAEETMKARLDQLVHAGVYKEACQFIAVLGLHQHYQPEQLLLPCIAEGRVNLVEEFVKDNEDAQRRLLSYLDARFDQQSQLYQDLEKCQLDVGKIRSDLLSNTALKKLILRLQKMFNLPSSVLPRVGTFRGSQEVAHLLFERYVRHIKRPDWTAVIVAAVGDSRECALRLVEQLLDFRENGAARKWARHFNVTPAEVPMLSSLKEEEEEEEEDEEEAGGGSSNDFAQSEDFLEFPLIPREDIEMVRDEDELYRAIEYASRADKLGFDAEWTSLYKQTETSISILQMASRDCVFIIDMQSLQNGVSSGEVWEYFRTKVFEQDSILKIFYSALQDLQMICRAAPEMQPEQESFSSYRQVVDLEQLQSHCVAVVPDFFPSPIAGGLSGMVKSCLGKPLRKTARMSNWRARPLSQQQLVYAALDAHCLISLHDWLENRQLELGLDGFVNVWLPADLEEKKKKKKKRSSPLKGQRAPRNEEEWD